MSKGVNWQPLCSFAYTLRAHSSENNQIRSRKRTGLDICRLILCNSEAPTAFNNYSIIRRLLEANQARELVTMPIGSEHLPCVHTNFSF